MFAGCHHQLRRESGYAVGINTFIMLYLPVTVRCPSTSGNYCIGNGCATLQRLSLSSFFSLLL
uniref:Secreted protein n=1 Tax=Elaeophora elaphi TaxID=1147741 RepID=A0A0R3RYN1_9BILA